MTIKPTNQTKNPCSLCVLLARSYLTLCDPMGCSCQTPLTKGFCRHGYWSGLLFPSPKGISPAQGWNLPLLHWQAGSLTGLAPDWCLHKILLTKAVLLFRKVL